MSNEIQIDHIRRGIKLLFRPGWVVELRARTVDTGWRGFYFTDHERLADVVLKLDHDPRIVALYYVINPCKPNLIKTRTSCGCGACKGGGLIVDNPTDAQVEQILTGPRQHLTSNDDVETLVWMFTDVDTKRAPGFEHESSTDEEKAASKQVAQSVLQDQVAERGWPQPLLGDSGNGFHILWRVNLLNTQHNIHLIVDNLKRLKAAHDGPAADIDASVFNPARLTRAYGSTTRKGTNTEERPFRQNYLREPKAPIVDVTLDQLLAGANVESVGASSSPGMPELDPNFKPQDFFDHYEAQGAFKIVGEKDWRGNPIMATDECLFVGRKHKGDEYKSGFILGDTFGYKCFSDECEGKGIAEVFRILREAEDDNGNPLYSPFPGSIYKTDTLDELIEAFGAEDLDAIDKEYEAEASIEAPPPAEEPDEIPTKTKRLKVGKIKDLGGWMIACIFRDPKGTLPKFQLLKSHIEKALMAHLMVPVNEAMVSILGYHEDTRLLPSKQELLSWLADSTHGTARKLRSTDKLYAACRKYIEELQDDPTKEFTVMVTELSRSAQLEEQKAITNKNYKKYLKEDEDVQGFRIAERQHAQKELRSKGEIVGKPMQLVTEAISQEFLKDVEGINDAGKVELGFPAIDEHSHIGLNGERTICIYGPANVGKTTFLMTTAVNMAERGKNVLIMIGEHQALPMMKTLTLMLGPLVKDDPEIGVLPNRDAWEGLNRTATLEDWGRINKLLEKLRERLILPGWLGVENISAIAGVEEDRLGACIDYIHSFHMNYPLDAVIIDPLDQVMPLSVMGKENAWAEGVEVLQRIQNLSRVFEGRNGKGLMIITSAQFNSKLQREIEKNQAKTAIGDNMDDVIISLVEQMSQVQFFTTIPQHLDTMIAIVTRVRGGTEGYLVKGRFRFGSTFKVMSFIIDPVAHVITPKGAATFAAPTAAAAAAPDGHVVEPSMEAYDTL